jgi:hypothetical protein
VPSDSPHIPSVRLGVLAICVLLLAGVAGCTTTQEKAAVQQAKSKRILEAREKKEKEKR